MMSLKNEKRYPMVCGIIIALVGLGITWIGIIPCVTQTMLSSGMTIGAIFAGFDGVHKSLLIGLNTPLWRQIKQTEYFDDILSYMSSNLYWSLWFIVISFAVQWMLSSPQWDSIDIDGSFINLIINTLWMFLGAGMCASFARINKIFTLFIRQHKPNNH